MIPTAHAEMPRKYAYRWALAWTAASLLIFGLAREVVFTLRAEFAERMLLSHVERESELRVWLVKRANQFAGGTSGLIHVQINPDFGRTLFRRDGSALLAPWEVAAQEQMKRGRERVVETVVVDGEQRVRVGSALRWEASCATCHGDGPSEGGYYGGAFLETPVDDVAPLQRSVYTVLLTGVGFLWGAGLVGGFALITALGGIAEGEAPVPVSAPVPTPSVRPPTCVWSLTQGSVIASAELAALLGEARNDHAPLVESREAWLARLGSGGRAALTALIEGNAQSGSFYTRLRGRGREVAVRCAVEIARVGAEVVRVEGRFTELDAREEGLWLLDYALQGAQIGVWSWDIDTSTLRASDRVYDILGLPRAALSEASEVFLRLLHPSDISRFHTEFESMVRGEGGLLSLDHRVRNGHGQWRWVGTRGQVVERDPEGRPSLLAGTFEELHSNRLYAMQGLVGLHEYGPVVVFRRVAAENWPVAYVSANVLGLFGVSANDFISGKVPYASVVFPEDLARVVREVGEHTAAGAEALHQRYRIVRADGQVRWVQDFTRIQRDPDQSTLTYDGFLYDITDQVVAERAAASSQDFLEQLIRAIPLTVLVIDPRTYRVIFSNRGETGETCHKLGHGADFPCQGEHPCPLVAVRATRKPVVEVHHHLGLGGQKHRVEVTLSPILDAKGEVQYVVETTVDLEAQLRQQEERLALERRVHEAQRSESLGVLAGGVAHDFNNLLVGILGNAELLGERLAESPAEDPQGEARQLTADIHLAATRAADLTRQLLAFVGKGKLKHETIDLPAVTAEIAELARAAITRGARFEWDLAPAWVMGDITQIRQVVLNLVTNAAEALPKEGGTVWVRTHVLEVGDPLLQAEAAVPRATPWEGPVALLEVEDTGAGMSPEVQRTIFEPFFTTKATGRGLGLAAVAGIVQSHGGALMHASALQRGSVFRVLLPATHAPEDPNMPTAAHANTVMIIDDEPMVRKVAVRILQRAGYTTVEAESGDMALAIFPENPVAAAVIDLSMPGMDGVETLTALRALAPNLAAILVSGYASEEVRARLGGLEAAVLHKPFRSEELKTAVEALIGPSS